MYRLIIEKQPSLDHEWYERLSTMSTEASEIYYALAPAESHLEQQKKLFFESGMAANPNLRPSLPNPELYEIHKAELLNLQDDITSHEANWLVQTAYVDRISELCLQLDLLLAAHRHDAEKFFQCNKALYGRPSEAIFGAVCAWLARFAEDQLSHPDKAIVQAATNLLEQLPAARGNAELLTPPLDTFKTVQKLHDQPGGYLEKLFANVSLPPVIDQSTGDKYVRQVLQNIGCSYGIMESSSPYWGVSHTERAVLHPQAYKNTIESFTGVLIHEIGSHLVERMNGLHQPLKLLALGLNRYDACNEGRAYLREQLVYDSPADLMQQHSWRHIITLHLAASLASGLDKTPYDFCRTYKVINAVDLLWELLHNLPLGIATEVAHDESWKTVTRVLKGTDGTGGAYLKDIVYLEGNIKCWQAAERNPGIILLGDLGKFDITRHDHLDLLRQLGILPDTT
ncbi:MAG: tyrosine/phenylalanine carboxypeptidase domain-containing protein [Candidatus Saccharimonadales bacterium]